MRKVRQLIVLIMAIMLAISCCGCWNYVDVDQLFVVTGVGIGASDHKRFKATFEVGKAHAGPEGKLSIRVSEVEGDSVFQCLREAIRVVGSKLYWGHTMVIVISEEIAEQGIVSVLDMFDRLPEFRSDIVVVVTKEKEIAKIFRIKDPIHDSNGFHIEDLFEEYETSGKFVNSELMQVISDISSDTGSLTLPMFSLMKEEDKDIIVVEDSAVFKGDKMIGELNGIQTRSMAILKGGIKGGYELTLNEVDGLPVATVEVTETKLDVSVEVENNIPVFDIAADIVCDVVELSSTTNYMDKDKIDILQKRYEEKLRDEFLAVIDKAQVELETDIFSFGSYVYTEYPDYWKTFAPEWNSKFVDALFDIEVDVHIFASGTSMTPIKVGE